MNKEEIEKIVSSAALGIVRQWRLPVASVSYIERSIISAVEKILASMAKPDAK